LLPLPAGDGEGDDGRCGDGKGNAGQPPLPPGGSIRFLGTGDVCSATGLGLFRPSSYRLATCFRLFR